jgi:hypothetical protein
VLEPADIGGAAAWPLAARAPGLGTAGAIQSTERREFIGALLGAAAAWPLAAWGQQAKPFSVNLIGAISLHEAREIARKLAEQDVPKTSTRSAQTLGRHRVGSRTHNFA